MREVIDISGRKGHNFQFSSPPLVRAHWVAVAKAVLLDKLLLHDGPLVGRLVWQLLNGPFVALDRKGGINSQRLCREGGSRDVGGQARIDDGRELRQFLRYAKRFERQEVSICQLRLPCDKSLVCLGRVGRKEGG